MQDLSSEYTHYKSRQRNIDDKYQVKPLEDEEDEITLDQETEEAFEDRSDQINKITTEMKQLGELFSQVNQLVLNQDSILNRIDYNVEMSKLNISKANDSLQIVERRESSGIGRKVIAAESTLIIMLILVLITRCL